MRNIPSNRLPLILAIVLHVILFSALFIHFASPDTRNLQLQPDVDIIKAVAVNPADVAAQVTRVKAEEQQKQRKAQEAAQKLQQEKQQQREQAQAAQRQKEAEALAQKKAVQEKAMEQKVAEQKAAQQKAETAALLEQQQEEQKQLAEKTAEKKQQAEKTVETEKVAEEKTQQESIEKEEQTKKAAEKKQEQKAAQALKLAQQKALENEMAAEQKQLEAARTNQQQSEIDKYTALILHTMRQNWMIPEGVNQSISCQLAIHLNADGTVISVTLLRSSGNAALDNSARLAVFKSSPLPVPADTALFNEVFRQFNLTVSPKDIE